MTNGLDVTRNAARRTVGPGDEPFARVLAGRPEPVELAAVVVALRLLADRTDGADPASPPRTGWSCPHFTGPRSWRRAG